MVTDFKNDLASAIKIFLIVAVASVLINLVRTPILDYAASKGLLTQYQAFRWRGVNLIDNWVHQDPESIPVSNPTQEFHEIIVISAEKAYEKFESGECVFVDARTVEEFRESHIPGAVNWPWLEYDREKERLSSEIRYEQCVIVYCSSSTCDDSGDLANVMIREGWEEVYRFKGGMEEWNWNLYPVEHGPES